MYAWQNKTQNINLTGWKLHPKTETNKMGLALIPNPSSASFLIMTSRSWIRRGWNECWVEGKKASKRGHLCFLLNKKDFKSKSRIIGEHEQSMKLYTPLEQVVNPALAMLPSVHLGVVTRPVLLLTTSAGALEFFWNLETCLWCN